MKFTIQHIHGPQTMTTVVMNEVESIIVTADHFVLINMKSGATLKHGTSGADDAKALHEALCNSLSDMVGASG